MAVDTDLKRGSAMLPRIPWRPFVSIPGASIDQADRQVLAVHYSGILATGAASTPPTQGGSFSSTGKIGRAATLGKSSKFASRFGSKFLG